jgi:Mlc titration factor MtfA (ptsG expression regulator)
MPTLRRNRTVALLLGTLLLSTAGANASGEELVSFSCALAIDAVLKKLDEQPQNLVIQQALAEIDDRNGQFVCIPINANELQVRLQSTDMSDADNRLVFLLDAKTYSVRKTFYGR